MIKYNRHFILLLFVQFVFLFNSVFAAAGDETGNPFIQYFSPEDYNAGNANWCIQQDNRGVMYFANDDGILQYDGSEWRLIKVPHPSFVRAISIDENGRIYVAAVAEFGYLQPDSSGFLVYKSLRGRLDKKYSAIGEFWDVRATKKGVFFKTRDYLIGLINDRLIIWPAGGTYRVYGFGDDVYVRIQNTGLMKFENDSLQLIPGGEQFARIGVYDMLPYPATGSGTDEKILITTTDGLFLFDGKKVEKFKTSFDQFLHDSQLYICTMLSDSSYAIGTQRGGVLIMNHEGQLVSIVDKAVGLKSQIVYYVYVDMVGGLWLGLGNGIARVETPSPLSNYEENIGLQTSAYSVVKHDGTVYVADDYGVNYLIQSGEEGRAPRSYLVKGIKTPTYKLLTDGETLFASTNSGLYRIEKDHAVEKLLDAAGKINFFHSRYDPNIIFINTIDGIAVLKKRQGKWISLGYLPGIDDYASDMVEEQEGVLWINTDDLNVSRIQFSMDVDSTKFSTVSQPYFSKNDFYIIKLIYLEDHVAFSTDKGLKRFDPVKKTLLPDTTFGEIFAKSTSLVKNTVRDSKGDWLILSTRKGEYEIGRFEKVHNGKSKYSPISALNRLELERIICIYPEKIPGQEEDVLWIGTSEGLVRYDPAIYKNMNRDFQVLLRRVSVHQDSTIYNGEISAIVRGNHNIHFELPYYSDDVNFNFSATSYDLPSATEYRTWLENFDKSWSTWNKRKRKDYTNLPPGDYTFRVMAKDLYGQTDTKACFVFSISSPWWETWQAYTGYLLAILLILLGIRRYELNRIYFKNQYKIEQVAKEKLKELDQLKSRFFANLSHEFRTPLTLILGQLESVSNEKPESGDYRKLEVAYRNARRLLRLINQLLDLSKIEIGSLTLQKEKHNYVGFLKSLVYSFESWAQEKRITIDVQSDEEIIPVRFEAEKLEKVFYNLLSNAIKFTSSGGKVSVQIILHRSTDEYRAERCWAETLIHDNGIGIPEDQLEHVFDRFYQADNSPTRHYEGTGIGLSLAKELVELHDGKISVTSTHNAGTTFTVLLPVACEKADSELADDYAIGVDRKFKDFMPAEHQQQQNEKPGTEPSKEIILIVEDNNDVRNYISEQLVTQYRVLEARNGKEGLQKSMEEIPDLIITDVMMPEMDGYTFSTYIRRDEKTSHIPIIMLTAKAGIEDKITGLETGVDAYLVKPFHARELLVRVKHLISSRKNLRERFRKATVIKPREVTSTPVDQDYLEKVIVAIEENIGDEHFSVDALAKSVGMSVSQLNRKLSALIDQPAGQLIRSMRLQRAADLLVRGSNSIAEISFMVGFSDQANFTRAFKKQFGSSPKMYKKIQDKK